MKGKKAIFQTRNKCNQFLIFHLIRKRGKLNQNIRDHKFFLYNTAIESVKKYPLPIICSQQLKLLKGIGECLTTQLTSVIKQHYKKYLKPQYLEESKDQICLNSMTQKQSLLALSENNEYVERPQNFEYTQEIGQTMSMSNFSAKSETKTRSYKPRIKSQAYSILKAMKSLKAEENAVSKKNINEFLFEKGMQKIVRWETVKNTLFNSGYINKQEDQDLFYITKKGISLLENTQIKDNISEKVEKVKQHYEIQKKLEKYTFKEEKKKNIINFQEDKELILLIDNREIKDHLEKDFFQQKLSKKYNIHIETVNLAIGDFAWMYDNHILNYIVERKKADDLASSILDGRYKEQKYRLQNCGAKYVFYLYEGHPSDTCAAKSSELQNALLTTRFKDGLRVVKTKAINESANFLAQIHSQIMKKIKYTNENENENSGEIQTLGCLQDFNKINGKNKSMTLEDLFGQCLKLIPKAGKETVNNILKYFKTFVSLHEKLSEFTTEEERIQFLNSLLKGTRVQSEVPKILVDLLFKQNAE